MIFKCVYVVYILYCCSDGFAGLKAQDLPVTRLHRLLPEVSPGGGGCGWLPATARPSRSGRGRRRSHHCMWQVYPWRSRLRATCLSLREIFRSEALSASVSSSLLSTLIAALRLATGSSGVAGKCCLYRLVEFLAAFGIESRHAEHPVERHLLGSPEYYFGEFFVGERFQTGLDPEFRGAEHWKPLRQDQTAVELRESRVGLEGLLLLVVVLSAVGGSVDKSQEVFALLGGDLVAGGYDFAEFSPVLRHGVVVGGLAG